MFDQVGLVVAPGQLWTYVDADPDPANGVRQFLAALGLDPDRIRRGDLGEQARANEVLDLLLGIGDAFDHLAPDVARAVEARLASGEYDQVREAARAVHALARVARLGARWPDRRLALLAAFLRDVGESLADPLSVGLDDVAAAESHADTLTRLAIDFDAALDRFTLAERALRDAWPAAWAIAPEAASLEALSAEFETLAAALLDNEALGPAEVEEITARLHAIGAELEAMHARAVGGSSKGRRRSGKAGAGTGTGRAGGGGPKPGPSGPVEEALQFFGLDVASAPEWAVIHRRFRELARQHHPDISGDDGTMMKTLNQHYDTLKARCRP